MDDIAIKVEAVSKTFRLPHEKNASVKSTLINFSGSKKYEMQKALQEITFDVKQGEFFGIIGRNGSGKSTLLKLLAGIYSPSSGNVHVNGKLTPFIELGVGFNPELTGRENVYLNGALLGFNRKEMRAMYKDIVEFAELKKFMDQKLKNYSSGMQVRLAFSIAIRAQSDILLIDEVLAVGDANFQKKCLAIFEELKRSGTTIVFVSHSMADIRNFCDRVAVISNGDLVFIGNTEQGVDIYNKLNYEEAGLQIEVENKVREIERYGNGNARISKYEFFDKKGQKTVRLSAGENFAIELEIDFDTEVKNPVIGVMFRKNPQENLFGINSLFQGKKFESQKKDDKLKIKIHGEMPLAPGDYLVSFAVSDQRTTNNYMELDNLNNVLKIIVGGRSRWGDLAAEPIIELITADK